MAKISITTTIISVKRPKKTQGGVKFSTNLFSTVCTSTQHLLGKHLSQAFFCRDFRYRYWVAAGHESQIGCQCCLHLGVVDGSCIQSELQLQPTGSRFRDLYNVQGSSKDIAIFWTVCDLGCNVCFVWFYWTAFLLKPILYESDFFILIYWF